MRERAEEFIELADWATTHVEPVKITALRKAPKKKRAELLESTMRTGILSPNFYNLRDSQLAQEDLLTAIEHLETAGYSTEQIDHFIGHITCHPYIADTTLDALRSSPVLQEMEFVIEGSKAPKGEVIHTTYAAGSAANVSFWIALGYRKQAGLHSLGWDVVLSDALEGAPARIDYSNMQIVFNFEHFSTAPIDEVLQTIKHQTAHVLAGVEHAHNAHWGFEARLRGLTDFAPCEDTTAAPAHEDATVLRAVEVFDAMETEVIDTLKFQFAKKHKEYFDRTGRTLSDLFKLAQAGDL